MGSAFTPGLKISAATTIEKTRRLALKGKVLVGIGDAVEPDTIVASASLPGILQTVRVPEQLGVDIHIALESIKVQVGDHVEAGQVIVETRGLFGRLFRSSLTSPIGGTVELIASTTGHIGLRGASIPVEKSAYIPGTVLEVLPSEGVVIGCTGGMIQGIFGVGGERMGRLMMISSQADDILQADQIPPGSAGCILVAGAGITAEALRKAAVLGAAGIVCGGIIDSELISFMAQELNQPDYDIGVAITGQELISFTLIVTEGFGHIAMADRTFELLRSFEGKTACINGATQIRAGVIRPEIIVPLTGQSVNLDKSERFNEGELAVGTTIRLIREPYFGQIAKVTELMTDLVKLETGAMARALKAELLNREVVTVPRSNVEIVAHI